MNSTPTSPSLIKGPAASADQSLGFFKGSLRQKLKQEVADFDTHWTAFRNSWSELVKDEYMGDKGSYRYRRYAVFSAEREGQLELLDEQRHYQTRFYNTLNGGVFREYPCFQEATLDNTVFQSLLNTARASVIEAKPQVEQWRFEAHQFRILANEAEKGKPVPEGIHRDGVDYVFIFLIDRENVRGGVSRVYKPDGHLMAEMKLKTPLDFMVVNDHAVYHYVTPVHPRNSDQPAHRDVLVITVRSEQKVSSAEAA